jgi:glyoxylase-like metal-dependent hydrolase (beta-lactamase superfamily II)
MANRIAFAFIAIVLICPSRIVNAKVLSKISDSVYAYTGTQSASPSNGFGANAGIIVGQEWVIVIDTLASAKEARQMINDIERITNKPIQYVVNTHTHFDHCFGNSEFAKDGAIVIAHESGKANLMKLKNKLIGIAKKMGMNDEMLEGTTISYPSVTFDDRIQIDIGNLIVDLF